MNKITVYYKLGNIVLVSEDIKQDDHDSSVHQVNIAAESKLDFIALFK